jgi:hypothetical protein
MKTIYLSLALMVAANSFSQKVIGKTQSYVADRTFLTKATKTPVGIEKAQGDTLWFDGFTNANNWTQTFGTGHTSNSTGSNPGWVVVNSLPNNINSQQAAYNWPSTFSAANGNFALINSDEAGSNIQQDAYFEFSNNIDLTSAGNSALYLCFNEYYRNYYDGTFVEVSIDGGNTWTIFEANPESVVPVNTNCVAGELETINITSAIGAGNWTNQVKIRFHYTGDYDWFWGVDNIRIVQAWDNDVQVYNWFAATDITTTQGLDYFVIDDSQSSFPGLTFGAIANNNGGLAQASVAMQATATGGYNQTGASIAMNASATDSLSITTPYMPTGLGTKTIDLTTVITPTDANLANNTESLTMLLSANEYSRDNGTATGSISNVSSNTGLPLKIGNIMDVFNNWTTTGARVYLPTQATAAVGAEYWAEVYLFDGTSYVYLAETEKKTITSTASTWSSLKWIDGQTISNNQLAFSAGDDILLLACHTGGTTSIRFGMAQNTYEGSVLGYDGAAELFSLTSPGAIMVRLTDDASVGLSENTTSSSLSVYPNPSSDVVTIESNVTEGSIQIIDLTGKVVANQTVNGVATSFNTAALTNGMYTVILTNGSTVETRKFIVQH